MITKQEIGFLVLISKYSNTVLRVHTHTLSLSLMADWQRFYKDIDRKELYVKYIYKLSQLHEADQNFTEAGFTFLLHAKSLEWDSDDRVAAADKFPAQTTQERKEHLYQRALDLFDRGKAWECGIPLCKELASMYETKFFNYTKLAATLVSLGGCGILFSGGVVSEKDLSM